MPKVIRRKIWPEFFAAVDSGEKPFEVRDDDRLDESFEVGDVLQLEEWDPSTKKYTGKILRRVISYILDLGNTRMGRDTVVLGLTNVYPERLKIERWADESDIRQTPEEWAKRPFPGSGSDLAAMPWNEESCRGILTLVNERDRLRDLAARKTREAEDNLVRAVLAERDLAKMRGQIAKMERFVLETAFPEHPNGIGIDDERDHEQRASDLCRELGLTFDALRAQGKEMP